MQDLERIRFRPEIRLLHSLKERFDLETLLRHLESQEFWPHYQLILAQQVRLTPILAPRIFRLFDEVRETLEFEEETDLFVQPEPTINAFALHSMAPGTPHAISLTSEMIKSMNDDELRFAIGHEVGHLIFRHYRVNLLFDLFDEDPDLPKLLEARLQTWTRLAELSADRVGFLAAKQNLEAAVGTFFKLASGLGPEHLSFDLEAFLKQLEELQRLDRKDIFALFSHPITPVRVRALQLYAETGGLVASDAHLMGVDREVEKLAKLMEYEVSTELGVQALDFLVAGGLLAATSDGELSEQEQEMLVHLLLQFTGDPGSAIWSASVRRSKRRSCSKIASPGCATTRARNATSFIVSSATSWASTAGSIRERKNS